MLDWSTVRREASHEIRIFVTFAVDTFRTSQDLQTASLRSNDCFTVVILFIFIFYFAACVASFFVPLERWVANRQRQKNSAPESTLTTKPS